MTMSLLLRAAAVCCFIASFPLSSAYSFHVPAFARRPFSLTKLSSQKSNNNNNEFDHLPNTETRDENVDVSAAFSSRMVSSRREWIQKTIVTAAASSTMMFASWSSGTIPALAAETKILLLGGTGLVGSQIRKLLLDQGIPVVATSRNGRDGTVALDFTTATPNVTTLVQELAQGCSAVISTVGVIGTPDDGRVNGANAQAAAGAKAAGVSHFVYITVAPQVKESTKNVDFLQDYMQGKTFSRESVITYFGDSDNNLSYTLIEPTFIYGGDKFQLNPPRVNGLYGGFIEGALSSAPLRLASNIVPGGLLKVALEPPVSAEVVAKAAIAGALGKSTVAVLDTYDKIQQAASAL